MPSCRSLNPAACPSCGQDPLLRFAVLRSIGKDMFGHFRTGADPNVLALTRALDDLGEIRRSTSMSEYVAMDRHVDNLETRALFADLKIFLERIERRGRDAAVL